MNLSKTAEFQGTWDAPKELAVSLDGVELARGEIVGFRLDSGTEGCSNEDCIGCIEDEVVWLAFKLPPPKEPKLR
jgi:hypothetical protein